MAVVLYCTLRPAANVRPPVINQTCALSVAGLATAAVCVNGCVFSVFSGSGGAAA